MRKILFSLVFYFFTASGFCGAAVFLDEVASLSPQTIQVYTFEVNQKTAVDLVFQHAKYSHTIPWTVELRNVEKKRLIRFKSPGDTPQISKSTVLQAGRYVVKVSASHQAVKKSEYQVIVQSTEAVNPQSSRPPMKKQVSAANIKKENNKNGSSD